MKSLGVVLLQGNPAVAQSLSASLSEKFRSVRCVGSLEELRNSVAKHRAEVVILDIENTSIHAVQELSREFPRACIVCTHRLADEQMWMAALDAGAADVCPSFDTPGILNAALRNVAGSRSAVA